MSDWATFAGVPAVCYPFGWAVGKEYAKPAKQDCRPTLRSMFTSEHNDVL